MGVGTIVVDLLALAAIVIGALMVFRQERVRAAWAALTGKAPGQEGATRSAEDDPAHYALSIFGMMLLAFGIIIFGFFTVYALTI